MNLEKVGSLPKWNCWLCEKEQTAPGTLFSPEIGKFLQCRFELRGGLTSIWRSNLQNCRNRTQNFSGKPGFFS